MALAEGYYMGIDIGTHESKGVIIDSRCRVVAQSFTKHTLDNPQPGWFEHDAEKIWWNDFCILSKKLIAEAGLDPIVIRCVGASALGCDCVPVDEMCRPLHKAILYGIDSRTSEESAYLNTFFQSRGLHLPSPLCSSSIAPKILWFKRHYPQIHQNAHKFLTASSYLTAKLTGQFCMDQYLAASWSPLYELDTLQVNEYLCDVCCRPEQLADLRYATDIAGHVTSQASAETGLREGTPVLTGTGDSGAEAISAGVFQPGDIMIQLGSTCFFIYYTDHIISDNRLWPGTFIIPGSSCISAGTNTAGLLTQWYRDTQFPDLLQAEQDGGENAYSMMSREIQAVPAGANGLITLPYFAGERTPINDPLARGVIFGLQLYHNRTDMYKSALEGIGYSIAQHFDILSQNGLPINKIIATGGGTKNPVWLQIIADMLNREICIPKITIGAAYGDAIMAALSSGAVSSWKEMDLVVEKGETIHPIAENHQIYQRYQPIFNRLYDATKNLMHTLA